MTRVEVKPELYSWAMQRARLEPDVLLGRFPKLEDWMAGDAQPTFKQLEKFAAATHAPFGFFFLPTPPSEPLPIADFRTLGGAAVASPSADLLDTIYVCQQRQDWYRDFTRSMGDPALSFVGSVDLEADVTETAAQISEALKFDLARRKSCSTWAEALRHLVEECENAGVLVMVSGVVGNNTTRVLDPEEFRGFCLVDDRAPLVFVNGADSKSAQMFTLIHEVAHLWLGKGGVSNFTLNSKTSRKEERWCNAVAAEVLVPLSNLKGEFDRQSDFEDELERLCRLFKVSSLVILRRLLDARFLTRERFDELYRAELSRLAHIKSERSPGGNFYYTEAVRVSRRFARALLSSTFEGNTLFRDASRLLGIKKAATLDHFADQLNAA